jgi:hypothetical protein
MEYTDLSIITNNAYKLAELIEGGHYTNIFYYEFHEEIDSNELYNPMEGLNAFQERGQNDNKIFISNGYVDEFPAIIHVALKVGEEWFIAYDCGANYYLGYGPSGILKLRKACANKNVTAFSYNENFDEWVKKKFRLTRKSLGNERKNNDALQFQKLCKALQYMTVEMQRRPEQHQHLTEEDIRDRMLTTLNAFFKGRGQAESKNRKGKTDILVGTIVGLNEHIFELKVWNGINTIKEAIEQLLGYVSWHNNFCAIVIFNYNKNLTNVLKETEKYLKENYSFEKREQLIENEFRILLKHQTDMNKRIETHIVFINLCK